MQPIRKKAFWPVKPLKVPKMTFLKLQRPWAQQKLRFLLSGGPWDGERVLLLSPSTLVLSIADAKGRYVGDRDKMVSHELIWEAA